LFFLSFCNFWLCTSLDVETGFDIHYLKKVNNAKQTHACVRDEHLCSVSCSQLCHYLINRVLYTWTRGM
jgi:hypothetical protein